MKYVVVNDADYNVSTFGLAAVEQMDAYDVNNVSTFNGDFTAFKERGGKIISYHGRADPVRDTFVQSRSCNIEHPP